jgi:hypothetical protein
MVLPPVVDVLVVFVCSRIPGNYKIKKFIIDGQDRISRNDEGCVRLHDCTRFSLLFASCFCLKFQPARLRGVRPG